MPKIRGIKPDYWTDEDIVDLSIEARLLFIGLWTYACDNGHLQDKPKQIKMRIFPGDDVNTTELLRELVASGRITRGDGWITIPNLTEHQKPDLRYFTTCDKEGCDDPPEKVSQRNSRRVHGVHTPSERVRTESARVDGDGDGDGELMVKVKEEPSRKRSETEPPNRFEEFWDTYSHKVGRKKSEAAYRAALKKPGVTEDLLIAAAASYITWQMSEGKHPNFTKAPLTWLHGEHWRDERPARAAPSQQHVGRAAQWLQLAADLGEPTPTTNIRQIGPS